MRVLLIEDEPTTAKAIELMLTTEGSRDAVMKAIKAGATAYMTKPFFEKDLTAKMLNCLGLGFDY